MLDAVRQSLAELALTPADLALRELALATAVEIDTATEPADVARFSTLLRGLLADLGATPAGRARITGRRDAPPVAAATANPLESHRLRAVK